MPQVSVIIATHNRAHLLPEAIASARNAGRDVEIVVVDDASADETRVVCEKLSDIRYLRLDRNHGAGGARNVGLLNSTGECVLFLDDDDRRLPGSLDAQLQALQENPSAGFACGGMIVVDQNYQPTGEIMRPGHPSGDVFWNVLELDFPATGLSTLIRRECLLRVGLFREHLNAIEDWDILVRLAELYPAVVHPEPVGVYRQSTPDSKQWSSGRADQLFRAAEHQKELLRLPRVLSESSERRKTVRRRMKGRIADTLLVDAATLLSQGYFTPAAQNVKVALRLNPLRACRLSPYRKLLQGLRLKSKLQTSPVNKV